MSKQKRASVFEGMSGFSDGDALAMELPPNERSIAREMYEMLERAYERTGDPGLKDIVARGKPFFRVKSAA
jgi:hypothetical protein